MAIVLTAIGTALVSATSPLTLTVAAGGIPAGSLIVAAGWQQGTTNPGAISDNGTVANTYTSVIAGGKAVGTSGNVQVYYAWNCKALASGNKLSLVTSSSCAFSAFWASGISVTADPLDTAVTASGTGTSAAPSVASGTPAVAGELMVGVVGFSAASTTYTQDSTHAAYQNFPVKAAASANLSGIGGGAVVNASATALTYAPAITSAPWAEIFVGFKPAPILDPYFPPFPIFDMIQLRM